MSEENQVVEPTLEDVGEPEINEEILAEARNDGWRPLEEFKGDPKKWVSAEIFVQRGREINPILRKSNARLQAEIDSLKHTLADTNSSLQKVHEYNAKIEQRAYERAVINLRAERKQALVEQDMDTVAEIDDKLDELKENKPTPPVQAQEQIPAQVDPALSSWMAENRTWFNTENQDMVDHANGVGIRLRRENPALMGVAFLDTIKQEVERAFPEKFGSKRGTPAAVEGSAAAGAGAPRGRGKGVTSLPADVQKQFKSLSAEKWYVDLAKSKGKTAEKMFMEDYEGAE